MLFTVSENLNYVYTSSKCSYLDTMFFCVPNYSKTRDLGVRKGILEWSSKVKWNLTLAVTKYETTNYFGDLGQEDGRHPLTVQAKAPFHPKRTWVTSSLQSLADDNMLVVTIITH